MAATQETPPGPEASASAAPAASPPARRYAGASAQERQTQRRERLLEAAFDIFGREGYRNATMRLICAQARLTERYFYESFSTIDEVFSTVHRRQSAAVSQRILAAAFQATPDDGVAQVRAGLQAFFEYIKEDPRRAQILLIDAVTTGLTNPQNLNAQVSKFSELVKERLRKRFPDLPRHQLDVDYVVAGFVGLIVHTGSLWVERGFKTPVDVLVDHNVYAWQGLHAWLGQPAQAKPATPPAQP